MSRSRDALCTTSLALGGIHMNVFEQNAQNAQNIKPRRFRHFGEMLRHYRDTYGERKSKSDPAFPRGIKLPAAGVVQWLNEHDYDISQSTYSEIESGISFPRYSGAFIDKVCECLGLNVGGDEWLAMNQQLVYDIVAARFGPIVAGLAVRDEHIPSEPVVNDAERPGDERDI